MSKAKATSKVRKKPTPRARTPRAPRLPQPVNRSYTPVQLTQPGRWLVLSDCHFPYHDLATVELAIALAVREKCDGVLLNGDTLDCAHLSTFDKDPSAPRYVEEIAVGKEFLTYLRYKLPKARIIWKDGNHEERLQRYLMGRAPELFGFAGATLPAIMDLANFGVEHVGDKRVIRLGHLHVLHGHEYRPQVAVPVNPARGIFLRAKALTLCGHWHQTSEHHEPTVAGKPLGSWSSGCACQLAPAYSPLNKWNHGFARVDVHAGGEFTVRNLRVMDGKVV